jgi:AraC family transcriptional regulator of adaptative response/methylated-DNA-[protein]-cysteine methyltransferase
MDMKRDEMLRAFMEKDATCDGLFFAGVTSTMIFCRPSCAARKPKPENVEFYPTAREALFAGFRPCRRCHPLQDARSTPEWAVNLFERVEADLSVRIRDAELREQGLEPAAVRRYFQKSYGMTFQAYCRARRLGAAFTSIRSGGSIDDAVFDNGWESHSGFRAAFARVVQVPPGAARGSQRITLAWVETPLGPMAAGATESAVCLLEFTDRRMLETQLQTLTRRFRLPLLPGDSPLLDRLRQQLQEYFSGARRSFDQTRSYAALARELGEPGASRAVGHANGLNRIAILVPCHRVIAADGGLGGYGGGLWRKLRLLEQEGAVPAGLTRAG